MCQRTCYRLGLALLVWLLAALPSPAEEVLFEDNFDQGLSKQWQLVGLGEEDYRIREGALELKVQPGKLTRETPMLFVNLPLSEADTVVASVEITLLSSFTEPAELAGLYLIDDKQREFGARKQRIDGHLVFSPGNAEFIGEPGEEGDSSQYALKYWPANAEAGPVKIIVRGGYAYFQVGPSTAGKYRNFFHSAIGGSAEQRGFALLAAGGPHDKPHWVRFDNFRVTK